MNLNIALNCQMEGIINFRVLEKGEEVFKHTQNNIFLNTFNDRPWLARGAVGYLQLGTDNATPPDPQQTSLINFLVERGLGDIPDLWSQDLANGYTYFTRTVLFEEGTATGDITEVGLRTAGNGFGNGWGDSTSKTVTRALISDSNGNPITITVASDQELEVTYEIRYIKSGPAVLGTGSFTFNSTTVNYTVYPLNYWHTDIPGFNNFPSNTYSHFWNCPSQWGIGQTEKSTGSSSTQTRDTVGLHRVALLYDVQNKSPTLAELNPESFSGFGIDLGPILNYSGSTTHGNFSYNTATKTAELAVEVSANSSGGDRNVSGFVIEGRRKEPRFVIGSGIFNTVVHPQGMLVIFDTDLTIPELYKLNIDLTLNPPQLV